MRGISKTIASDPDAYRVVSRCRMCGSSKLSRFLDLGRMPLANGFIPPEREHEPEARYPLAVQRCEECGLVQLTVVVRPEILFREYVYSSSASQPIVEHFVALADELVRRFALADSLVVEIGSNDGVLLRPLAARGARVLGVEAATSMAALARREGLETWNEFFDRRVAERIAAERGHAKLVVANNVLAHIDDLGGLVSALDAVLQDDGVFVAEVPYLMELLEHGEYDTIYHEHLSYFAVAPLETFFRRHGMELFDVRRLPVHGGSIRLYACRAGRRRGSAALAELLAVERRAGLTDAATYSRFAELVTASRQALRRLLAELLGARATLAAYGATAKGNTLLNYCGIGRDTLAFVADSTPFKQGLLTPGTHIPVVPEPEILARRPDYMLLLAWNYADEILRRRSDYLALGGRFIHPIPLPRIVPS